MPGNTEELLKCRSEIDKIDREMEKLFEARMECSAKIAAIKKQACLPVTDKCREADLLASNLLLVKKPELSNYYTRFMQKTIELSREYQDSIINAEKQKENDLI